MMWIGTVTRLVDGRPFVRVPDLGKREYGPVDTSVSGLAVGDLVAVAQMGKQTADKVVVVGRLGGSRISDYMFGGNYGIVVNGTHTISTASWEPVLTSEVTLTATEWVEAVDDGAGRLRIRTTDAAREYDEVVYSTYFTGYSLKLPFTTGHYHGARFAGHSRVEPMVPAAVGPSYASPVSWSVLQSAGSGPLELIAQDTGPFTFLIIVTPMMLGTDVP